MSVKKDTRLILLRDSGISLYHERVFFRLFYFFFFLIKHTMYTWVHVSRIKFSYNGEYVRGEYVRYEFSWLAFFIFPTLKNRRVSRVYRCRSFGILLGTKHSSGAFFETGRVPCIRFEK